MAHAVHPNYGSKYEDKHKPKLNQGVVLKVNSISITSNIQINANARYATNSPGLVLIDEIARRAGQAQLQRFVVRNDSSCGSTIGPMLAAKLGLRSFCQLPLLTLERWIWETHSSVCILVERLEEVKMWSRL